MLVSNGHPAARYKDQLQCEGWQLEQAQRVLRVGDGGALERLPSYRDGDVVRDTGVVSSCFVAIAPATVV